jgi:hypothetical protein
MQKIRRPESPEQRNKRIESNVAKRSQEDVAAELDVDAAIRHSIAMYGP